MAASIFQATAYVQIVLICLLTPLFMAGAIVQESNPRTWDILLSSTQFRPDSSWKHRWQALLHTRAAAGQSAAVHLPPDVRRSTRAHDHRELHDRDMFGPAGGLDSRDSERDPDHRQQSRLHLLLRDRALSGWHLHPGFHSSNTSEHIRWNLGVLDHVADGTQSVPCHRGGFSSQAPIRQPKPGDMAGSTPSG